MGLIWAHESIWAHRDSAPFMGNNLGAITPKQFVSNVKSPNEFIDKE